jgi:hypothetical protein
MSKRLFAAFLPLLALAALSALPAAASAALTLSVGGTPLSTGAEVKGESSNLVFKAPGSTLTCSSNVVSGTLTTNKKGSDKINLSSGSFTEPEPGGLCKSTLGPARVTAATLPWTLTLAEAGTSTIKGESAVTFNAEFTEFGITCIFEANKVADTFNIGGALIDSISGQKFTRGSGSSVGCPEGGELNGSFALTSGGSAIEATT